MVSVIVPTYNYGRFIKETLQSVLDQSSENWECIIVDNGSTDNTDEVVKPFLRDKRFTYYKQENKGVSRARNTGLKKAKGEFILFLDADDIIETEKIKESLATLKNNPGIDLVYTDVRYFKTENRNKLFYDYACNENRDIPWMKYISGRGLKLISEFLDGNLFVISSPVFRASITNEIGFFDESIGHNEDWDFWLRMSLAGKNVQYMDCQKCRTLIRVHKSSASINVFRMQLCGLKVLLKNSSRIKELGLAEKLNKRISDHVGLLETTMYSATASQFRSYFGEIKNDKNVYHFFKGKGRNSFLFRLNLKLKRILKRK